MEINHFGGDLAVFLQEKPVYGSFRDFCTLWRLLVGGWAVQLVSRFFLSFLHQAPNPFSQTEQDFRWPRTNCQAWDTPESQG